MGVDDFKNWLRSSTSMDYSRFNGALFDALSDSNPVQLQRIEDAFKSRQRDFLAAEGRWAQFELGEDAPDMDDLVDILKQLEEDGLRFDASKAHFHGRKAKTPFSQQDFMDALQQGRMDAEKVAKQLEKLREEAKKEQGFIQKNFNIFADRDPVGKAMRNLAELDKYCYDNGIKFDEVAGQLEAGPKPKTAWDRIKEFRFLIAAAAGGAIGLAGVNLMAALPTIGAGAVGLFFGGLPYVALPFISLSIFRAMSQKNIFKEIGTFGRFGALMLGGFAISMGVTAALSGMLPSPDMIVGAAQSMSQAASGFNPSQYILHGIAAFAAFGTLYRVARDKVKHGFNTSAEKTKKGLSRVFEVASDITVNRVTAPVINAAGKVTDKLSHMMDKGFLGYLNVVGIPAITALMSYAMSEGGLGSLAAYGGYYGTVFSGMAVAGVAIAAAAIFVYGARKKELTAMGKVAGTALGTSSSAATMPVTKEQLKEMGVADHTANSVVPLGANFNMLGTSLYLGATAAAAMVMFGMAPTIPMLATVAAVTVLTAFGAPGMPSSNLILLDPVLDRLGLDDAQTQKIYQMVIPLDRILDMCQTALNVMGDVLVALDIKAAEKGGGVFAPIINGLKSVVDAIQDRITGFRENMADMGVQQGEPVNDNVKGVDAPAESNEKRAANDDAPAQPRKKAAGPPKP